MPSCSIRSDERGAVSTVDGHGQAMQRIGATLERHPVAHRAATLVLQTAGLARRPRQVSRYLNRTPLEQRRLLLGSGPVTMDGWLCTDLVPVTPKVVYLDATKPWPLPSESFRYVVCEHMIEHVTYEAGLRALGESHRVLVPGGVLRISTPNLDTIRRLPDLVDAEVVEYVCWSNTTFGSPVERSEATSPVHVLNRMMRSFGHTYLYDDPTLRRALAHAGFKEGTRCEPGTSAHPAIAGVDRHAELIGEAANRVESMIMEATA
jgi:predicted SAM-dependent methyltransferase